MTFVPESIPVSVVQVAAGLVLVFWGRQLFWFFVGVIGFILGFRIGLSLFPDSTLTLVVACAVGLIATLLSIVLEKFLIVVAAAAAGWVLCMRLAEILGAGSQLSPLLAICGAVLFAVFSLMVFDVALAVISSLSGAALVLEPFSVTGMLALLVFAAIAAIGMAVQLRRTPPG